MKAVILDKPSGELARRKKSSRKEWRRIDNLWTRALTGFIILVNVQGAVERPKGMNWKTKIRLSTTKAKNIWKNQWIGT